MAEIKRQPCFYFHNLDIFLLKLTNDIVPAKLSMSRIKYKNAVHCSLISLFSIPGSLTKRDTQYVLLLRIPFSLVSQVLPAFRSLPGPNLVVFIILLNILILLWKNYKEENIRKKIGFRSINNHQITAITL